MVAFQKFMFDNFVIGEDTVPLDSSPLEAEDNIELDTEVVPDNSVEDKVEAEELKTYTEEELADIIRQAEEQAYEKGFKSAQSEQETQHQNLLQEINNRLMLLVADSTTQEKQVEEQVVALAGAAIHKLIPVLTGENAQKLVSQFLTDNFKHFKDEAKLSFYFHPDILPFIQEQIAILANRHDFEGKIALHKDASMSLSDCRVVWQNGGVETNRDKMLEKVDNLLEETIDKN